MLRETLLEVTSSVGGTGQWQRRAGGQNIAHVLGQEVALFWLLACGWRQAGLQILLSLSPHGHLRWPPSISATGRASRAAGSLAWPLQKWCYAGPAAAGMGKRKED